MTSMSPKQVVESWVEAFNRADVDALTSLYDENAVNHQVAEVPVNGKLEIGRAHV